MFLWPVTQNLASWHRKPMFAHCGLQSAEMHVFFLISVFCACKGLCMNFIRYRVYPKCSEGASTVMFMNHHFSCSISLSHKNFCTSFICYGCHFTSQNKFVESIVLTG
jgi:hypothetical protein